MKGWIIGLFLLTLCSHVNAQIWLEETRIDTSTVITGIEIPWDMEWWSDDTIVFTQIDGTIQRLAVNSSQLETIYTVPSLARENQAGLMGMQMHPNWPDTAKFYIAYTYYDGSEIDLRTEELIYDQSNDQVSAGNALMEDVTVSNSNTGCRILIAEDNTMYVTMGDVKDNSAPQDPASLNGKVLRMNLDGSVPSDNPNTGSLVFTLGHRNAQGIVQTPSGNIFISEHGPFTDDEINLLEAGSNYGWPLISGPCSEGNQDLCDSIGAVEPLLDWTPTIAPCGIDFYDNPAIPEWRNSILMATLKDERLHVLEFNDLNQTSFTTVSAHLKHVFGRIRDVLVAPNGEIFLATTNKDVFGTPGPRDDRVIRLTPTKHNGLEEYSAAPITVHQHNSKLYFSEPVIGDLSICDLTGKVLKRTTMLNETTIDFVPSQHFSVLLVSLQGPVHSINQKLIIH